MKFALYGKGLGNWLRMTKQEIDGVSPVRNCVYASIEDAMNDAVRFPQKITTIKIKNLDTKAIVYQGNRKDI